MNNAMKQVTAAILATIAWSAAGAADEKMELNSEADRASYAIGYQIGGDMKRLQFELNGAAVTRGIADAAQGGAPAVDRDAMNAALAELKRKVLAQERSAPPELVTSTEAAPPAQAGSRGSGQRHTYAKRMAPQETGNIKAFFAENAARKGVLTLPSGVQYKVLHEGSGKQPKSGSKVELSYRGSLADGNEFGTSERDGKDATRTFDVDALVPGLRDAVLHMKEGAEWQVFVPPHLGFDARTPLFRKVTVFDIRLAAVVAN